MAGKRPDPGNADLFCWEQVQRVNPLFRVSRIFAPPDRARGLLALHALFAAIEETCAAGLDQQLAQQKLLWWQRECLGRGPGTSRHPILELLSASGSARVLESPAMSSLFETAFLRIDGTPLKDETELFALAGRISRPQAELEMELLGLPGPGGVGELSSELPSAGLLQLMRESVLGGGENRFWWLPLSLQARHGASRAQVAAGTDKDAVTRLFRDLVGQVTVVSRPAEAAAGEGPAALRHLRVAAVLQRRVLERIGRAAPSAYARQVRRVTLGDVYTAWRTARRFTRPI